MEKISPRITVRKKGPPGKAKLQWVQVGEEICHVSDFANLPPPQRPTAFCPVCKCRVTLRLGNERVYYAAHHAGDICAVTQPETALHYNVKYYLQAVLRKASHLFMLQTCRGRNPGLHNRIHSNNCENSRQLSIAEGWDNVIVEHPIGPFRADVALLRGGLVVGVIEVQVTHPVDEGKARTYKKMCISWVEIQAAEGFYQGERAWTPTQPIAPLNWYIHNAVRPWKCAACLQAEADARRLRQAQAEREARGEKVETSCIRIVDFYYPSGKKFREIFWVKRLTVHGEALEVWLERDNYETVQRIKAPTPETTMRTLAEAFEAIRQKMRLNGTVVDSPMRWQPWPKGRGIKDIYSDDWFPYRYTWQENRWVLRPADSGLNWNGYWEDQHRYTRQLSRRHEPTKRKAQGVWTSPNSTTSPPVQKQEEPKEAICSKCGEAIQEWWGRMTGVCRKCMDKGIK